MERQHFFSAQPGILMTQKLTLLPSSTITAAAKLLDAVLLRWEQSPTLTLWLGCGPASGLLTAVRQRRLQFDVQTQTGKGPTGAAYGTSRYSTSCHESCMQALSWTCFLLFCPPAGCSTICHCICERVAYQCPQSRFPRIGTQACVSPSSLGLAILSQHPPAPEEL